MYKHTLMILTLMVGLFSALIIPGQVAAEAESKDAELNRIIKKVDELYRATTSWAEMEMHIVTPNWERTMSMEAWSEGMDKTFITILSPKKDKGIATLRVDKEMWNFFPKINKVMKVPPSMMMGSWMGSDFTNDDLVKESSYINDYNYALVTPEGAEATKYYIELTPKTTTVSVWGKIIMVVDKASLLPVAQEYYDEKGRMMRVMNFKDVTTFGDRTIPATMEMIPMNKKGHKTVVKYLKAKFNIELDKSTFSLRNLKKAR